MESLDVTTVGMQEMENYELGDHSNSLARKVLAIEVKEVFKSFGAGLFKNDVLRGINLNVSNGSIYTLLGPSGCGKTTLLRLIVNRMRPDSGQIRISGYKVGTPESGIPGSGVGYMPQELALYKELSISETLNYIGRLHYMSKSRITNRMLFLLELLQLPEESRLIKNLSGGQQRRVSFALSLLQEPPLLILDEPTVGVDPLLRRNIWEHLVSLSRLGKVTILITTHYVEEAKQANQVSFMRNGRILVEDTPENVLNGRESLDDVFLELSLTDSNETDENSLHPPKKTKKVVKTESEQLSSKKQFKLSKFLPSCVHILAVAAKNYLMMWRNLTIVLYQLLVPGFQLAIFCLALKSPHDLPVAIVNSDPVGGQKFLDLLNKDAVSQVNVPDLSAGFDMVLDRSAWGVIEVRENLSYGVLERYTNPSSISDYALNSSKVHAWFDMTDAEIGYLLEWNVLSAYQKYAQENLESSNYSKYLASLPVVFDKPIYGSTNPDVREFMGPGIIITMAYFMAVALTSVSFIQERKGGLLDRSYVAGISSFTLMSGHIIAQCGIMIIQILIMMFCAIVIFEIPSKGNLILTLTLFLLQGLVGVSTGFTISTICDDEQAATALTLASFYPNIMLSGVAWPIEGMPDILQKISIYFPVTLAVKSVRSIMSCGLGLTHSSVWPGFVTSGVWLIIFSVLSMIFIRIRQ